MKEFLDGPASSKCRVVAGARRRRYGETCPECTSLYQPGVQERSVVRLCAATAAATVKSFGTSLKRRAILCDDDFDADGQHGSCCWRCASLVVVDDYSRIRPKYLPRGACYQWMAGISVGVEHALFFDIQYYRLPCRAFITTARRSLTLTCAFAISHQGRRRELAAFLI